MLDSTWLLFSLSPWLFFVLDGSGILLSALGLGVLSILYSLFYFQVPSPKSQVPSPSPSCLTIGLFSMHPISTLFVFQTLSVFTDAQSLKYFVLLEEPAQLTCILTGQPSSSCQICVSHPCQPTRSPDSQTCVLIINY